MRYRQIFVAVGVVLFAASCTGSAVRTGESVPEASASGVGPATIVVDGRTLYLATKQDSVDIVFLDSDDPRVLWIRYARLRGPAGRSNEICLPPVHPFAYVAGQDATSVTVGIAGYRPHIHGRSGSGIVTCSSEVAGYRRLRVRLDAPLGDRAVRDDLALAGARSAQVVTEHSVPSPTWIPAGYVAKGLDVGGLDENVPERVYRHGRWELDVLAGKPNDFPGAHAPNDYVNKYPATTRVEGDFRSVTWTVSPQRTYEIDAFTADQRDGSGGYIVGWNDLNKAQVLRVAASLP